MLTVTAAQLRAIAGGKAPLAAQIAESFNPLASAFGLTTPLRVAHFLAQLAHESGFRHVREIWGPTAAQRRYEARADLGNTHPGDGERFKGRGLIQVTGRANARELTAWIRKRYPDAPDFEATPEAMEQFPWALVGAFWFWETRKLNALADRDDVVAVTKKVNGGTNGLADRKAALARAKTVLGIEPAPKAAPVAKKAPTTRPAVSAVDLPEYVVRAAQERFIALGYHDVGLVDGKVGKKFETATRQIQQRAADLGESVLVDGIFGPQTRNLLDATHSDRYENVVSDDRKNLTARDLAKMGAPTVVQGRQIQWANVASAVSLVFGVLMQAVQNYQAGTEMPWWMSTALGFLPPWVALVAPFLIALYSALVSKGLIRTEVERTREGIINSGAPPAKALGGIFGPLFGGR